MPPTKDNAAVNIVSSTSQKPIIPEFLGKENKNANLWLAHSNKIEAKTAPITNKIVLNVLETKLDISVFRMNLQGLMVHKVKAFHWKIKKIFYTTSCEV